MIFLLYVEVSLHYVCIQKLEMVPKAAIHLANTVPCQNLHRCCLLDPGEARSWGLKLCF